MKRTQLLSSLLAGTVLLFSACSKSETEPTTPVAAKGTFTAMVGSDAFSAPDAYIMPAAGGTIAVMAKDASGRSFTIAIFEKDFPVNSPVGVAYSPSISYADASSKTYIASAGTMTITAYGKDASGSVNNLKGKFNITVVNDGAEIAITEGNFDVNKK